MGTWRRGWCRASCWASCWAVSFPDDLQPAWLTHLTLLVVIINYFRPRASWVAHNHGLPVPAEVSIKISAEKPIEIVVIMPNFMDEDSEYEDEYDEYEDDAGQAIKLEAGVAEP